MKKDNLKEKELFKLKKLINIIYNLNEDDKDK